MADARPVRSGVSVRVRITAAVALLLALAMAGAGLIVYVIEQQRIHDQLVGEIDQEFAEFSALQDDGVDPDTGRPFTDVPSMLRTFLLRNVPDDNELLVGWWEGGPKVQSPESALTNLPEFEQAVRPLVATNGDTSVKIEGHGELLISAQQVRGSDTGALVVVVSLAESQAGLRETMRTYTVVAVLSLLLVTAIAAWLSGQLLAPLRTLRQTAEEISATDLSQRIPASGNDDITALTRTVNGMLDRLEAAFQAQREFLDDAGHELKTPLTVLRGHLEVLDSADPDDVEETQRLLLDEVDRMSRLVGDLILLAKSRRPDFLTARPAGVDQLTQTIFAKAKVLGDRDWRLDGTADVTALLDEQRITQAVLQLADNAVKHTAAGDLVAIGSRQQDERLLLWVRDAGAGIPEHDREHVFERFGRSNVRPGDGGFGLGLSIVRAIVEAHRGRVWVEGSSQEQPSGPTGARFVIELPLEEDLWPTS